MQIIRKLVLGAAALGVTMAAAGAIHAQGTVLSDGTGNTIITGSGGTVLKDGAGNVIRTPSSQATPRSRRRMAHPPAKIRWRRSRSAKSYTHGKGNHAAITHGTIRGHQADGQYGTITRHGITGRDANGEKGSITY